MTTDTRTLAILGASGDLANRYLYPALAELDRAERLPDGLVIGGVGFDEWGDGEYREHVATTLDDRVAGNERDRLLERLHFVTGDATDPDVLGRLPWPDGGTGVAYLALPPAAFADAIEALATLRAVPGLRVAIEKPFGTGLDEARSLNRLLERHFGDEQVFRVDHFLGHQTAQNILGARFANRAFAALWDRTHVASLEVVWDETLALEGRAEYYDTTGAARDMIQNHLLQLSCLATIEEPARLAPDDVQRRKVEVLRAMRAPSGPEVRERTVRARYGAGELEGRSVPAYVDEKGVEPGRDTETFAAIEFRIDNERWRDVPFSVRTGKALAEDRSALCLRLLPVDGSAFRSEELGPQLVTFGIDPDYLELDLALSGHGDPLRLERACLDVDLAPADLSAYARVLLAVLENDRLLAVGADEVEEQWRIVEPVLDAWAGDLAPLAEYPAGSDGPARTEAAPARGARGS